MEEDDDNAVEEAIMALADVDIVPEITDSALEAESPVLEDTNSSEVASTDEEVVGRVVLDCAEDEMTDSPGIDGIKVGKMITELMLIVGIAMLIGADEVVFVYGAATELDAIEVKFVLKVVAETDVLDWVDGVVVGSEWITELLKKTELVDMELFV